MTSARAGNTWDGGGGDSNWTTGNNWNPDGTPSYGTLIFDNLGVSKLSNYNDNASLAMNAITFTNASLLSSYNLFGNNINLYDNGGTQAKIENYSTVVQYLSLPITFAATVGSPWAEINPVNGDLVFSNSVSIAGSAVGELRIYGDNGKKVTFNGIISGSGKKFLLEQYSIAEFNNAMTYTGNTEINKGEIWIGPSGDISGSSAIYVGNGGLTANTAKLFISDLDGGTTFDNTINVNGGNGAVDNRTIGGLNTSGENTFSGTISRASDGQNISLTLYSGGGTVNFSGNITGDDAVLINADGAGVIKYSTTAKTYSGDTYVLDGELLSAGNNVVPGTVYVGETFASGDETALSVGTGFSEDGQIVIRNGSGATKYLRSRGTGTGTFTGNVALDDAVTFAADSSGKLVLSGQVQDGAGPGTFGAAVNAAGGTVQLAGAGANSGVAQWTVQAGTLELNKSAGTDAIDSALTINGGGTVRDLAANQINDGVTVSVQSGGTWDLNSFGETISNLGLPASSSLSLGTAQLILNNGSGTYAGAISGSAGGSIVKKNVTTTINLTGNNTGMAGDWYIDQGVLGLNHNNAAGSGGTLNLGLSSGGSDATLDSSVSDTVIANNIVVRGDGGGGIRKIDNATTAGSRIITFNGSILLDDVLYVDSSTGETIVLGGIISQDPDADVEKLVKRGFGTVTLGNANTYTGNTEIDEGTIRVTGDIADGSATYIGNGGLNGDAALELAANGVDLGNTIQVNPALSSGNRTISATATSGSTALSGTVNLQRDLAINANSGSALTINNLNLSHSGNNDVTINNSSAVTVSGTLSAISGASQVIKQGAGLLAITGNNSASFYMLDIHGGTVAVNSANALGAQSASFLDKVNFYQDATLNVTGNTTLNANIGLRIDNAKNATLSIDPGVTLEMAGPVANLTGSGNLVKTGTGTLKFTGANTYGGSTTVNDGTLWLDGATHSGSGPYVIGSAGTLKGTGPGSGHTVSLSGVISPGNSPGTMATGSQTWNNGGSYLFEINDFAGDPGANPGPTGWDLDAITGSLDLTGLGIGQFTINLFSLAPPSPPDTPGLALNFNSAANYSLTFVTTTAGVSSFAANKFVIDTTNFQNTFSGTWSVAESGFNLVLNYTAAEVGGVPEPGVLSLLLAGASLLYARRRIKTA